MTRDPNLLIITKYSINKPLCQMHLHLNPKIVHSTGIEPVLQAPQACVLSVERRVPHFILIRHRKLSCAYKSSLIKIII